jgi:hypothetical protein
MTFKFKFLHTGCSVSEVLQVMSYLGGMTTAVVFGPSDNLPTAGCVISFGEPAERQRLYMSLRGRFRTVQHNNLDEFPKAFPASLAHVSVNLQPGWPLYEHVFNGKPNAFWEV